MNSTKSPDSATRAVNALAALIKDTLAEFTLYPDKLRVDASATAPEGWLGKGTGEALFAIRITPDDTDFGRVLGTRGAHFNAIIALCRCVSFKHEITVELKPLAEPKEKVSQRYTPFEQRADWPKARLLGLIERLAKACMADEDAVTVECKDHAADSDVFVRVSVTESLKIIELTNAALAILGNSIGKPNGRTLTVKVFACEPGAEPQPETADGRFSKEVASGARGR